jgi:hypothetical protein
MKASIEGEALFWSRHEERHNAACEMIDRELSELDGDYHILVAKLDDTKLRFHHVFSHPDKHDVKWPDVYSKLIDSYGEDEAEEDWLMGVENHQVAYMRKGTEFTKGKIRYSLRWEDPTHRMSI